MAQKQKKGFKTIAREVVEKADIILLVLDSRFPLHTRNDIIETYVKKQNKFLIYVFNKCDMVSKEISESNKKKLIELTNSPVVFVSSKEHMGSKILRVELSKAQKRTGKDLVFVGVLGYPNVGKSSVINLLKGKGVARSSLVSGFTKSPQKVRLNKNMILIDTPGVLESDDEVMLGLINAKNFDKVIDPYAIAKTIFDTANKSIKDFYKIYEFDFDIFLERLAEKLNKKRKGGEFDTEFSARKILQDWQIGNIKLL